MEQNHFRIKQFPFTYKTKSILKYFVSYIVDKHDFKGLWHHVGLIVNTFKNVNYDEIYFRKQSQTTYTCFLLASYWVKF